MVLFTFGDPGVNGVPSDAKSNSYTSLQSSGYFGGAFAPFNMIVYGKADAVGGSGHTVSMTKNSSPTEESTLIAVEARNARTIQSSSIVARAAAGDGVAYASASVTTTGPALLLSCWGGDGGLGVASQDANPEAGWTKIDSLNLPATAYIQAATAWKVVSAAGTYTVNWAPVTSQGAIVALVALA